MNKYHKAYFIPKQVEKTSSTCHFATGTLFCYRQVPTIHEGYAARNLTNRIILNEQNSIVYVDFYQQTDEQQSACPTKLLM